MCWCFVKERKSSSHGEKDGAVEKYYILTERIINKNNFTSSLCDSLEFLKELNEAKKFV